MHEGHRQRLAAKIKTKDGLYEHELMEVLLFNACPRKNVNAVAHDLVKAFGSVARVLEAPPDELIKVSGVGQSIAEYLVCLGKSIKKLNGCLSFAVVRTTAQFKQFITVRAAHSKSGVLELCLLDKDGRIRHICAFDAKETENLSDKIINVNSVYRPYGVFAANYRGQSAVLPTEADGKIADMLNFACSADGVKLYDYCIVSGNGEMYSYYVEGRLTRSCDEIKGAGNGII